MTNRQSFHIYKIIEDFSKNFISFDYSPKFRLFKGYYLSKKQVEKILEENGKFIKALYDNDDSFIKNILNQEEINIDEFDSAQTEENINNKNNKEAPLPIQARYVLKGYYYLKTNANITLKKELINTLNKKAFNNSIFPQIIKLALDFENPTFYFNATLALECCTTKEQYMLYYKLLAYYFRLNNLDEYKELCITASKLFEESFDFDLEILNKIDTYVKEKAVK